MISPDIAKAYKCTEQYINKDYVTRIPQQDRSTTKWYLSHFPIQRPDKDTTKIRIVFDASAKHDGMPLNDVDYKGPKLQRDLFDVLLRVRRLPVAAVCDMPKVPA